MEETKAGRTYYGVTLVVDGVTAKRYRDRSLDEEASAEWGGEVYRHDHGWEIEAEDGAMELPGPVLRAIMAIESGDSRF